MVTNLGLRAFLDDVDEILSHRFQLVQTNTGNDVFTDNDGRYERLGVFHTLCAASKTNFVRSWRQNLNLYAE